MMRTIEYCAPLNVTVDYDAEDLWFATCFHRLAGEGLNLNLPPKKVAYTFSVEQGFYDRPFGLHKAWLPQPWSV